VWYFTPFYAILRAVPSIAGSAFPGVLAMGAAVVILFFLPWIDRSPVKSIRYRGLCFKLLLFLFVADFIMLGYLGMQPTTDLYKLLAQIGTIYYFVFFASLAIIPKFEKTKPVPERVTE
jgi:ubiquinol-cytochrome c reductase cytochrome b subunit